MSDAIANGMFGVSAGLLSLGACSLIIGPVYIISWLRKDANPTEAKAYRTLPIIIAAFVLIGAFGVGYFGTPPASPIQSEGDSK